MLSVSLLRLTTGMTILDNALPDVAAEPHSTSDRRLRIVDVCSLVLSGSPVSFAIADRWGAKGRCWLHRLRRGVIDGGVHRDRRGRRLHGADGLARRPNTGSCAPASPGQGPPRTGSSLDERTGRSSRYRATPN
ncbi:hypothetical protein [Planobispora rosea]|uniref:hypothetical protein n=1 Tax=Planobispora rosea TaxID=35762 RepID=UPI00114D3150|nr:hypothetical protein [Planobispora rosea]